MGKKDTDLCTFCDEDIETLTHLFVECEISKLFWKQIEDWLHENSGIRVHISPKEIIMGNLNIGHNLFDLVYLIGKHYLYSCRCTNTFPTLICFMKKLRQLHDIEKQIALKNDKIRDFHLKWELVTWT